MSWLDYSNAARPSPGSWLARLMQRNHHHPDSFMCGLRVLDGRVQNEGHRWQYRRSAADQLIEAEVVTLHHGTGNNLRLRLDTELAWDRTGTKPRAGFAVMSATDVDSGARVLLAVPPGELVRFGVRGP